MKYYISINSGIYFLSKFLKQSLVFSLGHLTLHKPRTRNWEQPNTGTKYC